MLSCVYVCRLAQMLDQSKVCVSQLKVCACVIKCLIEVNGVVLLPALYFFWICVCLHMLCIELYRENKCGGDTTTTRCNLIAEITKFRKVMSQEPCTMKRASSRP